MRMLRVTALGILLFCPMSFGQAPPPESRALLSLLEEVQKLRQDLRMTAATIQRAQLLLYRMRLQMDAVSRATERLEQARAEVEQIKSQRIRANEQIRNFQERLDQTQDSPQRTQLEQAISYTKTWLDQYTTAEPDAQAKESECASQLRLEEAKLDDLQRQFDSLDRKLEAATQP
jgi:DNA repair exonuclease SbcCD ATPase subunit